MKNDFFNDTMTGLLEAIAIERGNIQMTEVSNMPVRTLKADDVKGYKNAKSPQKELIRS